MSPLNIKPTHKPIKNYYAELKAYETIGAQHEGAVRTAFQNLLQHYCRQADLILVCEKTRILPADKETHILSPDKGGVFANAKIQCEESVSSKGGCDLHSEKK